MMRRTAVVLAGLCVLASGARAQGAADPWRVEHDRDALWKVVSRCLSPGGEDYCRACPFPLASELARCVDTEGQDPVEICRETTQVWERSADFVAIRNVSMCGCPEGFVHGLALPLAKVSGIEDPAKTDGIWKFAWDVAVQKIGVRNQGDILLAVNSVAWRDQDQLHVHLARLDAAARRKIMGGGPVPVPELSGIWAAGARLARAQGLPADGYGIAVIQDPRGPGFLVATLPRGIERRFARMSCRP